MLFLGFVQNVAEILSILDIQCNCSYGTEASSLALIEGMSLGLATVASDYGGNPWQVDDGAQRGCCSRPVTAIIWQSKSPD